MSLTNNKRFKSRVLRVLFHILPRRTKRLVFITTLTAKVAGFRELDRTARRQLLNEFGLGRDPDALALPLAYTDKIWANRPIDTIVDDTHLSRACVDKELTRMSRQIVAMMPCWLVYAHTVDIARDVRELLLKRSTLLQLG